jgi:hypothetical protein
VKSVSVTVFVGFVVQVMYVSLKMWMNLDEKLLS